MGERTHNPPSSEFARVINGYFRQLVDDAGWDQSGRQMASRVEPSEPQRTVWEKFYKNKAAMTTNDIAIVARVFNRTPYALVAEARAWADPAQEVSNVTPLDRNVGARTEDDYEQASNEEQTTPLKRAAKKGTLKSDQ